MTILASVKLEPRYRIAPQYRPIDGEFLGDSETNPPCVDRVIVDRDKVIAVEFPDKRQNIQRRIMYTMILLIMSLYDHLSGMTLSDIDEHSGEVYDSQVIQEAIEFWLRHGLVVES